MLPDEYRDLVEEALNTLLLLAPPDINDADGRPISFSRIFGNAFPVDPHCLDLVEPMDDEPIRYPVDDQLPASVYLSRSLHNYPNWGARLLELEDVVKGQRPSTFNQWEDVKRATESAKSQKRTDFITILAFILSAFLLILALITLVYGAVATKEAEKANDYASIASKVADSSGALVSSFIDGCALPYCRQISHENNTTPLTMTTSPPTTTAFLTVTATAFATVTVTEIISITSIAP